MPFTRPTLDQIIDRTEGDIKAELGLTTVLRRSFVAVIARAISGASHSLHGHLGFISTQVFPDTAETEFLERWGTIWGVERKEAVFANLSVEFSGTEGTLIPAATGLQRSDGVEYVTDSAANVTTSVPGVAEVYSFQTVQALAALDGKYFIVGDADGTVAFWFDLDANGTVEPAHGADRSVEIDTIFTNEASTIVATKVAAAILADPEFSATALSSVVTVTNTFTGARDDIIAGTSTFTLLTILAQGVDAVVGGTVAIPVTCEVSGDTGNHNFGEALSLTSPIIGVNSETEVISTIEAGEDIETDDLYRERILQRIQQPPQGGSATDYISESLKISGVTRAWVFPLNLGPGTVGLTFVQDNEVSIIPLAPKVAEVQAAIDAFKPVTADATVFSPATFTVNMTIAIKPNSQTVRDEIQAQLEEIFFNEANPNGAYEDATTNFTGKILLSHINEAISRAAGEEDHNLISPIADVTPGANELAVLGVITWQTLI